MTEETKLKLFDEFASKTGVQLSDQQKSAVLSVSGPTLLLAVPGSGKTTVLIQRLGYMIYALGIDPRSILTMTYTVAAAADMKKRFVSMFGAGYADSLEFRTINGVCEKILMYFGRTEGRSIFTLAEEGTAGKIIFDICREKLGDYPTDGDVQEIRTNISYAKNMMLNGKEIADIATSDLPFPEIYAEYTRIMKENRLMDYDDQLIYSHAILRQYPQILAHYRDRFRYICVDEAQDTSKIQHEIISMLAGKTGNLFMVGDEDQSIYGFRAAYPDALINFGRDHPGAKILVMERNYRSDANIVSAADGFIRQNIRRYEKNMQANRPAVNSIGIIPVKTRTEQYRILESEAKNCSVNTAVLYRDNDSALPLIDILDRKGVPFNVRTGDYSFFTNKTVTDIRAVIDFAYDRKNEAAFMRIYSKMSLYIRRDDALRACAEAKKADGDITDVLLRMPGLSDAAISAVRKFRKNLALLCRDRGDSAVNRIVADMEYYKWLKKNKISIGRIQILLMLASSVPDAAGLLRRLDELKSMLEKRGYDPRAKFTMTTIHSAKGLEFGNVFIIDVADGIFPVNVPSPSEKAAMAGMKRDSVCDDPQLEQTMKTYEEERRLFYVGVTRAIDRLTLFEIADTGSEFIDCLIRGKKAFGEQTERALPAGETYEEYAGGMCAGTKVVHGKFGPGTIVAVNGELAVIDFSGGLRKTISLKFTYGSGMLRKAVFG